MHRSLLNFDKGPKIDLNDDDSEDEDDSSEEEDRSKSKVIFNFKPYLLKVSLIKSIPIEFLILLHILYFICQISLDLPQQAKLRQNLIRIDVNRQQDQLDQ